MATAPAPRSYTTLRDTTPGERQEIDKSGYDALKHVAKGHRQTTYSADAASRRSSETPVKIAVVVRSQVLRRWHLALLARLAARPGTRAILDWQPRVLPPDGVAALMQLEAVLHAVRRPGLATPVGLKDLAGIERDPVGADLRLALDAAPEPAETTPAWSLTFDGQAGEAALLGALLLRQPPVAVLRDLGGTVVASARPGSEAIGILLVAFEDTLQRLVTLVIAALDGAAATPPHPAAPITNHAVPHALPLAAKAIALAALRRIYKLCFNAPHWRVGWRADPGNDLPRALSSGGAPWQVLPDDGRRFYADPFALTWEGTTTLFVEDFSHRSGKGIISAVAMGPRGPEGPPRPVLETTTHLSYPHVFVHKAVVWMVPESSCARRIDLYRATTYPGGWVREATLVDDVCASDATLVQLDGVWWMFATVRDEGGTFSDALHLWRSPRLLGPWSPHPGNPVLIDIASARPAGAFIRQADGALARPVQDCRRGYGAALGLARVTRLDADGFAQEMAPVKQGPEWRGRLHTYNRCGAYEFIDGSARSRRTLWS